MICMTKMFFVAGLESLALPASPKRCMTTSSTRAGILQICSRILYSSLADATKCVGRILEAGLSSDNGL